MSRHWSMIETAWGIVAAIGDESALDYVGYPERTPDEAVVAAAREVSELGVFDPTSLEWVAAPIQDYFLGRPIDWRDLTARLAGSEFQVRVWEVCRSVPYGATLAYGELAALAGYRGAARAAGSAMASNPAGLLIPCHRIVAVNGLGGYGGDLARKIALLELEGVATRRKQPPGRR